MGVAGAVGEGSERIADREMERKGILEGDVEIMGRTVVVGHVEPVAEVSANHHHPYIHAQADARAEGYVLQEGLPLELSSRAQGIVLQKPDVAGVEEDGPMQHADDGEAVFRVELKLKRTGLVEVAVADLLRRAVGSRADGADREGAYRICSADIELF